MKNGIWKDVVALLLAVVVRILFGYLEGKYTFFHSWLVWFNAICIAVAVFVGLHIVYLLVRQILADKKKAGKQ